MDLNKIKRSNFEKMCRTCLNIDENVSLEYNTELFEKLHFSIGVKLEEDDDLPNLFCKSCTDNINMMCDFKRVCLYSQQLLADAIKNEFLKQKDNIEKSVSANNVNSVKTEEISKVSEANIVKISDGVKDDTVNENRLSEIEEFDRLSDHTVNDSENEDNTRSLQGKSKISCKDEIVDFVSSMLTNLMTSKTMKLDKIAGYKCLECGRICRKRLGLKKHMLLHIPKEHRQKYCTICDKTYSRDDTFIKHLKHHQHDDFQVKKLCTFCGKSFLQLKQHMLRVHSENKSYHCSKCDRKFAIKIALRDHIRKVHDGKKNIKLLLCPECGKTFKSRRDLESHVANHTGQKPYKCIDCKLEFKWSSSLHYHMKKKHSLQPEEPQKNDTPPIKEPCQLCGKSFTNLRYHTLRIHSENKPYSCQKCDKKYPLKSYLKEHVNRVHDGIVKPKNTSLCPQCGKTFSCPRDLQSHIAFHAGVKLYKCTLCDREFTFKQNLNEHMKIHHNASRVKNFACTYCDKKFTSNTILRNHIRTHTGERPFSCKICQKSFTQDCALKTHMKIHNPEGKMNPV